MGGSVLGAVCGLWGLWGCNGWQVFRVRQMDECMVGGWVGGWLWVVDRMEGGQGQGLTDIRCC